MSVSILVVDDEPDVALLFRQRFRREVREGAYVMHFANSGEDALQQLANGIEPQLIRSSAAIGTSSDWWLAAWRRRLWPLSRAIPPSAPRLLMSELTAREHSSCHWPVSRSTAALARRPNAWDRMSAIARAPAPTMRASSQ